MESEFSYLNCPLAHRKLTLFREIQAYLEDAVVLVPDHHNEVNIAIKGVTQIVWFPSAYKSYVYATL